MYPGSGFFIGIFYFLISTTMVVFTVWHGVMEPGWILGFMAAGFAWFTYSVADEFVGWFAIPPQRLLGLTEVTIETPDRIKLIAGLRNIYVGIVQTRKSVNFLPAGRDTNAIVKLVFRDGTVMRFRAGQGPFTTFDAFGRNLGEEDVNVLLEKIAAISEGSGIIPNKAEIHELARS